MVHKYEIRYIRRSDEKECVRVVCMRVSDPVEVANHVIGLADPRVVLSITKVK